MSTDLRVLILQMNSVDDVEKNLTQIFELLDQVPKSERIDLICLPENCLYLRVVEGEKISALDIHAPVFKKLEQVSHQRNCYIHLGSVPLSSEGKLTNASVLIEPGAGGQKTYEKIHLFDIELEGQKPIRESDVFHHGKTDSVMNIRGWKVGQTICYDLRFAELFSRYAKQEVDLVLVPAAFLVETGKVHWEILLRARGIESQCYVIAAAQAGIHKSKTGAERRTFGHSLAVDPWGTVAWSGGPDRAEAKLIVLQKSEIQKVRKQIPMKQHRRLS